MRYIKLISLIILGVFNNLHISAQFNPSNPPEPGANYRLTVLSRPEGAAAKITPSMTVPPYEEVEIFAFPANGYSFSHWEMSLNGSLFGDILDMPSSFFHTVGEDITFIAVFVRNAILGATANGAAGKEIPYEIAIENGDDVSGFSVVIEIPEGLSADFSRVKTTDRTIGKTITSENIGGNKWRIRISGSDFIKKGSGPVAVIPVTISETAEDGSVFNISLSEGQWINDDGSLSTADTVDGKITVENLFPDYAVSGLKADKKSVSPGEDITLEWRVSNNGNAAAKVGWEENIILTDDYNTTLVLGTIDYDTDNMEPGAVINRSHTFKIPEIPGMSGTPEIKIELIPKEGSEEPDKFKGNNTITETSPFSIKKLLYLSAPDILNEGEYALCTLTRSGSSKRDEVFNIKIVSGSQERLQIPSGVTISNGNTQTSFNIVAVDNNLLDGDEVIEYVISNAEYELSGYLQIIDDEKPELSISFSKDEIEEGESTILTISFPFVTTEDIEVTIECDYPSRFEYPSVVIIPKGTSSVEVTVYAIDNDKIENDVDATFKIYSESFLPAEDFLFVKDNDMPSFTFTLNPVEVNESAGRNAIYGSIVRTDNFDKEVTFKLSDDSQGQLVFSSNKLTMYKNQESLQFIIGILDNSTVEGDRKIKVQAELYDSSCDCALSDNKGILTAEVTIIDDDDLALSIMPESAYMLEGSVDNKFTVSRNTVVNQDLRVSVSSNREDLLNYDHTLIIPAGETTAVLLVDVKSNDTNEDDSVVSFKVEAEGYSPGTCWTLVSDNTLPDATVELQIDKNEGVVLDKIVLTAIIGNQGNSSLDADTDLRLYFSGNREYSYQKIGKEVKPGENLILDIDYILPASVGTHFFQAYIDPKNNIKEQIESNNSSQKVEIEVLPPFRVLANADRKHYNQGERIEITGQAIGNQSANADVEIYIYQNGFAVGDAISAKTDSSGNFTAYWQPHDRQLGSFEIRGCYPGVKNITATDAFEITGFKSNVYKEEITLEKDETVSGKIKLTNTGSTPISGIKVRQLAESDNCEFSFDVPSAIEAGGDVELNYSITGTGLSEKNGWQLMPVEISSAEGMHVEVTFKYYVYSPKALLQVVDTDFHDITLSSGKFREYPVTILNTGKEETGKISLSVPSHIKPVATEEMESLKQGEYAVIWVRFLSDDLPLNRTVSGYFGLNCENGEGIRIPYSLKVVNDYMGTVKIDAVDEFTYGVEGNPHISNAKVYICDPVNEDVLIEGLTDKDGIYSVEIPEGTYSLVVKAENHKEMSPQTLVVEPAKENYQEVFLYYDGVTIEWNVVESEEEDEYNVEIVPKFETGVPKPVIVVTTPDKRPEPGDIIPITVTNKGLIRAIDFELSVELAEGYKVEYLDEPFLDILSPQQTYVFYVRILESDKNKRDIRRASNPLLYPACFFLKIMTRSGVDCDKHSYREWYDYLKRWGDCPTNLGGGMGIDSDSGVNPQGNFGPNPYPWNKNKKPGYYFIIENIINGGIPAKSCSRENWNPAEQERQERPDNGTVGDYDPNGEPLELNIISNDKPDESDCGENPVLVYKLIPVTGTRYEMKGVGADGVSQLKLVLDPEASRIPIDNCNSFANFKWSLSADYGKIESISNWEAVYTAPEDFGQDNHLMSTITISATLSYDHIIGNSTYREQSPEVRIQIIRPPLLLIHGLNDKGYNPKRPDSQDGCWSNLFHKLKGFVYEDFNIERVDYSKTHNSSFYANRLVVGNAINRIQKKAKANGFICTKCDLVGHSMGGVLSRIHVQKYGDDYVNKLITVNTPHSGSEWGDAVVTHKNVIANLCRILTWNFDIDAIADLAVESDAIAELNQPIYTQKKYEVATHAIATETNFVLPLLMQGLNFGIDKVAKSLITKFPWGTLIGIVLKYSEHFLDDVAQVGRGDIIVSTESQKGGYEADFASHITSGPFHCNSPHDDKVMAEVIDLLNADKHSGRFGFNYWFNPPKRSFEHSKWWIQQEGGRMLLDIFVSKKFEKYKQSEKFQSYTKEKQEKIKAYFNGIVNSISVGGETIDFLKNNNKIRRQDSEANDDGYYCNVIRMNLFESDELASPCVIFQFEDGSAEFRDSEEVECIVPSTYSGDVRILVLGETDDGVILIDETSIRIDSALTLPAELEIDDSYLDLGAKELIHSWCIWEDGSETSFIPESVEIENTEIARYENGYFTGLKNGRTVATVRYKGLEGKLTIRVFGNDVEDDGSDSSDEERISICSTISLSLNQKMVMTRQSFRGTLKMTNGNTDIPVRDVRLNLVIKDEEGNMATAHEFQTEIEKLDGFVGELQTGFGWDLEGGETGEAVIKFIPTKYAAPEYPMDYTFGGFLSYLDPVSGKMISTELIPVTLTVNPSPELDLHYFLQRDLLGDDPMTPNLEPVIPGEFALVIDNKGNGECKNLFITTRQPVIIDNEKELAIDFKILKSQLNGVDKTLVLSDDIVNEIGSIAPHSQVYSQWWLYSSLTGHFIEYDVSMNHVSSYDNPDLSLIDKVSVHELIHGFTVRDGEKPIRGFLVNDVEDPEDAPDMIYFSDATSENVKVIDNVVVTKISDAEYRLQFPKGISGWIYGSTTDPTNGTRKLTKILKTDGSEVYIDNLWQTDRTLRDGKDPIYENRVHFVADISSDGESYILTFDPKPEIELTVVDILGVPAEGEIYNGKLNEVVVRFNKEILPETFTTDDLKLYRDGKKVDGASIIISGMSDKDFKLSLNEATYNDGYYVLMVSTTEISDSEGFCGTSSKTVSWIQQSDGKRSLVIHVIPEDGGTVNPQSGMFDYNTEVELTATPATGYGFVAWKHNDIVLSTESVFTYLILDDTELTAEFAAEDSSVERIDDGSFNINIMPVPIEDHMVIYGDFNEIKSVNLYDSRGIISLSSVNVKPGDKIDTSHLSPGIYILTVITDKGEYSTKLIKK